MAISNDRGSASCIGFGSTTRPRQYPPSAEDDCGQTSEPCCIGAAGASPWQGATQKDGGPHLRNFVDRLVIKGSFEPSVQSGAR